VPNNVTNMLTVSGEPETVKRFFAAINGGFFEDGKPMFIDFNKIKPMPEALNVESGYRSNKALELYVEFAKESAGIADLSLALGDKGADTIKRLSGNLTEKYTKITKDDPELLIFGERLFDNIRNYGSPTWYEWCTANWGTKWNAYNQERLDDNTIVFDTAWAGIPGLMLELSERFPDVLLSYKFGDEQWGFNTGELEFEGGECTFEHQPPDFSPDAKEIAEELFGEEAVFDDGDECDDENEDDDDWGDEV